MSNSPIGVFGSGIGGLTLVSDLHRLLPAEDVVYFGDTARMPYGVKSRRTVTQFALEDARFLLKYDPKLIVAACNTASAVALDELEEHLPVPVVGVVKPGAWAAVQMADGAPIAVIGTEATIASGAYTAAIRSLEARVEVIGQACPLFVPLLEEGRDADDPLVKQVVESYLTPLRASALRVVVLGCVHYPLLRDTITACLGPKVHVVDSGYETAKAVRDALQKSGGLSVEEQNGKLICYVSDSPTRFRRIGERFLDEELENVELVEPELYTTVATGDRKKKD